MKYNKLFTQANIYWTTVKVMIESLDKMNLKGISDPTVEEAFYGHIFEAVKSVSPEYEGYLEKLNISVCRDKNKTEIKVVMIPKETNSSPVTCKLSMGWDDLPDKVREKIILEKNFNQVITFSRNEAHENA